jgi:hypothetical protein
VPTVHGDLLWVDGGWPGSCHEQELLALSGVSEVLDAAGVATIIDRGFRGLAKAREHWHAPVGDRRTKDRLPDAQGAYNRCRPGLRALVEQAIGHLANAWALRRWRGLLHRLRDIFRAAGALMRLGPWLHGSPPERASRTPSLPPPGATSWASPGAAAPTSSATVCSRTATARSAGAMW